METQPDSMSYKSKIRNLVRGAYDLQELRIETGNRLVANFRNKLGIDPDEEAEGDADELMEQLEEEYQRLTDGVAQITRRHSFDFEDLAIIGSYVELRLVDRYKNLVDEERRTFNDIKSALSGIPIWDEFLEGVTGVGPAMGGCIISEMNPHKAPHPSSFWKYCGLAVIDGEGQSRKKEHMTTVEYTNSNGEKDTRKSLGYNPFIKTKLMGVLSGSFLRSGSEYREFYDDYKRRKRHDEDWEDASDGHIDMASKRYMIKQFLVDLHIKWRDLQSLPVSQPYHAKKLGKDRHISEREERLGVTDPKRREDA
jgi:3-hydroxymyristoyl/3-hydroxydecanoyl-(acyl carrier protein) dehydratase